MRRCDLTGANKARAKRVTLLLACPRPPFKDIGRQKIVVFKHALKALRRLNDK
jgi:hypothetical protein